MPWKYISGTPGINSNAIVIMEVLLGLVLSLLLSVTLGLSKYKATLKDYQAVTITWLFNCSANHQPKYTAVLH